MTAHADVLRLRAAADLEEPVAAVRGRPQMRSWVVFLVAVVLAFFGLILSRVSLDRSAFVLEELERGIAAQETHQRDLRLEVARLQAPERLSALADGMGFVYPAERIRLEVPAPEGVESNPEYRWAQLRSQPIAHR